MTIVQFGDQFINLDNVTYIEVNAHGYRTNTAAQGSRCLRFHLTGGYFVQIFDHEKEVKRFVEWLKSATMQFEQA